MALKKSESKTPSPFARPGNRNARGPHAPGAGAPLRNKRALKTGEYETIFFTPDIVSKKGRALLEQDYDKYVLQYLLIDTLVIREHRILKRIRAVETAAVASGMVLDIETIAAGNDKTRYVRHDEDGAEKPGKDVSVKRNHSTVTSRSALERIMRLEDALTKVRTRMQTATTQLHRMEIEDTRMILDLSKYELYRQRLSGRIDFDGLIDEGDRAMSPREAGCNEQLPCCEQPG